MHKQQKASSQSSQPTQLPKIIAIVHEILDDEVEQFSTFMNGAEFYLNADRSLYYGLSEDGKGNWLKAKNLLLRGRAWTHGIKSLWSVKGNIKGGEGNLLGGTLVMDPVKKQFRYLKYEEFTGYDWNAVVTSAEQMMKENSAAKSNGVNGGSEQPPSSAAAPTTAAAPSDLN